MRMQWPMWMLNRKGTRRKVRRRMLEPHPTLQERFRPQSYLGALNPMPLWVDSMFCNLSLNSSLTSLSLSALLLLYPVSLLTPTQTSELFKGSYLSFSLWIGDSYLGEILSPGDIWQRMGDIFWLLQLEERVSLVSIGMLLNVLHSYNKELPIPKCRYC